MKSLKIIFAGTPSFAATALQALLKSHHHIVAVYTQPDRPKGRGQKLTASPVKELALHYKLPVYQPDTLRNQQEELRSLNADIMVVAAYGLLLPADVLTIPRLGCINIHASLLPRWRGAAPIQRAILAGDKETGITIMQMEQGLDTGPMLLQAICPIDDNDTTGTLHDKLADLGAKTLLKTLEQETFHPQIQDAARVTYAHKITKQEAQIHWQQSADEIDRQIRAFNPSPVTHTTLDNMTVRIWQAEKSGFTQKSCHPGEILQMNALGIQVATGQGMLRLLKLQLPGGKIVSAADICNAQNHLFTVGKVLV